MFYNAPHISNKGCYSSTLTPRCAECVLAFYCTNKLGWPWIWRVFFQNLNIPFSINDAITDVQVTPVMGRNTPLYQHRCWLWTFALVTIWMIIFLFSLKDITSSCWTWGHILDSQSVWESKMCPELGPRGSVLTFNILLRIMLVT